MTSPPPEIVEQGTEAILAYLRDLLAARRSTETAQRPKPRYEAKLVLVGLGAAGKTCLVKNLCGRTLTDEEKSTQGISITTLPTLPHPSLPDVQITLNAWDFAGQEIEHATHRFFLTRRSLYLVLWKPREGKEQEEVEYWLRTIALHAPGSRVLLVATYADDNIATRLDVDALRRAFAPDSPRAEHLEICELHHVGNMTGQGIAELRQAIAREAAQVLGMGELWTPNALRAEEELLALPDHDLPSEQYAALCAKYDIAPVDALGYRGRYWYELGKLLYFPDDPHLKNLVVLKPDWISKAVSRVMNDPAVAAARGILDHRRLEALWNHGDAQGFGPYPPLYYDTFLRLMYRFELSYELPANSPSDPGSTLVPHLLPIGAPDRTPQPPTDDTPCVRMIYRFGFLPAGLMSRFIVRTHRYAHNGFQWRTGVVLEYKGHLARVEMDKDFGQDICTLTVWGIYPHNFFVMLKGTMDDILRDYKGLQLKRQLPCPTPACRGMFEYETLEKIARRFGEDETVRCPECIEQTSIRQLLYGIDAHSASDVANDCATILAGISDLKAGMDEVQHQNAELLRRAEQQSQQLVRFFTELWEQHEAYCPSTFLLMPIEASVIQKLRNLPGQEYSLYFMCQNPQKMHMHGSAYRIRQNAEWWCKVCPLLSAVVKLLRCVRIHLPIEPEHGPKLLAEAPELSHHLDAGHHLIVMEHLEKEAEKAGRNSHAVELWLAERTDMPRQALGAFYNYIKTLDDGNWRGLREFLSMAAYSGSAQYARPSMSVDLRRLRNLPTPDAVTFPR